MPCPVFGLVLLIFRNLPSPRPTSWSSSESRFGKSDTISEWNGKCQNWKRHFQHPWWATRKRKSAWKNLWNSNFCNLWFYSFFKLCYKNIPKIQYSIKVASDLTVTVYRQGVQVKRSLVLEIASTNLNTCTSLNKHLEAQPVQDITRGDILEDVIEKMKDPKFEENVKIDFIVEQLTLAFKSPNGRRYSLLAMSALLQRMSPTSYKQMYSDGFLTLPSPSLMLSFWHRHYVIVWLYKSLFTG